MISRFLNHSIIYNTMFGFINEGFDNLSNAISSKAHRFGKEAGRFATGLAKKARRSADSLGKKVKEGARQAYNYGLDHAKQIGDVAGKVSDVAGYIQKGATAVGAGIAATGVGLPLAGVVEGIGGLAGGVSKVAGGVQKGAEVVEMAKKKGILTHAKKGGGFSGAVHLDKLGL